MLTLSWFKGFGPSSDHKKAVIMTPPSVTRIIAYIHNIIIIMRFLYIKVYYACTNYRNGGAEMVGPVEGLEIDQDVSVSTSSFLQISHQFGYMIHILYTNIVL